jgi:formyltetrahydrofolate hydrolase
VSHRDTIKSFRRKSEDLEAMALHEAVRSYTENRVTMVKGRTVIFT